MFLQWFLSLLTSANHEYHSIDITTVATKWNLLDSWHYWSKFKFYERRGSHSTEYVDAGHVGCNTMWTCRYIPTSGMKMEAVYSSKILIYTY
jgi:hypothetical protein